MPPKEDDDDHIHNDIGPRSPKLPMSPRSPRSPRPSSPREATSRMKWAPASPRADHAAASLRTVTELAEQGNVSAMLTLARLLKDGKGCERSDAAAVEWLQKAVEQGHAEAAYELGRMTKAERAGGEPGEPFEEEVVRLFTLAAEGGHPEVGTRRARSRWRDDRPRSAANEPRSERAS